jgi:hypothetical protein
VYKPPPSTVGQTQQEEIARSFSSFITRVFTVNEKLQATGLFIGLGIQTAATSKIRQFMENIN